MKTTKTSSPKKTNDDYFDLVRRFPLRPIRDRAEYDAGGELYFDLACRANSGELSEGESDYKEILGRLISEYDEKHSLILQDIRDNPMTPLEALQTLMEANSMSNGDLGKLLGIGSGHVSLILNGKRGLSKPNIRILAERFRVNPSLFL